MYNYKTPFRGRYILFFASVLIIIVAMQLIILDGINQQKTNAELINVAGRQRMLGQRTAKLVLYLHYSIIQNQKSEIYKADSLKTLVHQMDKNHQFLVSAYLEQQQNKSIDSLLKLGKNHIEKFGTITDKILRQPTVEVLASSINELASVELPFLRTSDLIVSLFQKEAESKVQNLKTMEFVLSVLAFLILSAEFIFIILPALLQLRLKRIKLEKVNASLEASQHRIIEEQILLRTIIDNVPANIYAKDKDSRKILANKAEYQHLGATREIEVLGKSDLELYPNGSASISIAEDKLVFDGNSMINVETLNTLKDGKQTWFLISKVPLRNEQGQIRGLVGISTDITERKLALEQLEEKEKLYRLLSENSTDVISLHKTDGKFEYISPSCIDLHGYPPAELIGKNGLEFIHPEDAAVIESTVPSMMEQMKSKALLEPMQFRLASKHRGYVWVENVMKPILNHDEVIGFQSTVRDISMRKAAELNLELAKQKAEQATLAKSQF